MSEGIIVVKFGTELLKNADGVDEDAIDGYAAGLAETYEGQGLIVVTSGAVAAGRHRAERLYGKDEVDKALTVQQLAALGSTAIFNAWERAFAEQDVLAASIAVTHRQLAAKRFWQKPFNREERRVFAKTLSDNNEAGIPTILNEADAISVTELMKLACGGDNDGMGSHVAWSVGARAFTIFTARGGIFDDEGQLIDEINNDNISEMMLLAKSREAGSSGRGGLSTKIAAAREAAWAGIDDVSIAAVNKDMTGDLVTRVVVG